MSQPEAGDQPIPTYTGSRAQEYEARRRPQAEWQAEDAAVAAWLAGFPRGLTVLDAPVGTGRFLPRLVAAGHTVIGVDRSPDMLALAAAKQTPASLWPADLFAPDWTAPLPPVDLTICLRFANWAGATRLPALLRAFLAITRQAVLVGCHWTVEDPTALGGRFTQPRPLTIPLPVLLTPVQAAGWIVTRRLPIKATSRYCYDLFELRPEAAP